MTDESLYDILKTEELQNKTEEADLATKLPLQSILTGNERSKHDSKWRIYQDRKGDLKNIK